MRPIACSYLIFFLLVSTAFCQRQMERLGRGVIAIKSSSTQVYVGWRLLGNDPEDVAFNLYRVANGGAATKLNSSPLTATTDYVDTPPSLSTTAYTYSVKPVLNGIEVADTWANPLSGPATLPAGAPTRQYIPVPMQPTPDDAAAGVSYDVKFCWVGDFDGDGEYDFLIDRTNPNIEARQWLQAYKRDGTLLWQMNMGPNSVNHYNITPGSSSIGIGHGDNVTVYDLDGDGKAEVIVRTANGVVFPNGTTLNAPDNEVQYLSIIDGVTGTEKARATIPIPAGWATKTHMNGQMGIVYADGLKPSIFFHPSNRNPDSSFNKYAATWDYRNGALTQRWLWLESGHTAEGHQVRLADVDNDGKDEYVDIGNVVKADGSGQINENVLTEVGHGDRFHVADIDPDRPGEEMFLIQQNNGTGLATVYSAADKSSVIRKWYASGVVDVGRGTIGAFMPALFGLQFFSTQPGVFDAKGNQIFASGPFPPETIWWDGDLGREFCSTIGSTSTSPGIDKFNATNGSTGRLFSIYSDPQAPGYPYNNYIAYGGRPQFWGDILGDWREELICVASDNSELRIYTTKIADLPKTSGGANFRIYTLMQNPQYRVQATTKGYVQSSYVDYYLGYGMTPPPPPPMVDAKLVWKGGAGTSTWDSGTTASWSNNGANSTFTNGDTVRFDLSGNNATVVMLNGTLQPGALTVYNPKDYMFAGTGSLAGPMKLTKVGAGSLTLPGTHTFTGRTTIWDGALVVDGNLQSSPVTVWGGTWGGAMAAGKTGGRLAGTGLLSQPVIIKYRGTITPGTGMNNVGTLTFANGLTAESGATFALDLSDDPAGATRPSDRLAVLGNLALSGTVSLVVNPVNGTLAAGTYTLATYTGTLTGSVSNLNVIAPAGTPYTLAAGSGAITMTIKAIRPAATVSWRGSGAAWDIANSQNWLRAGSPDVFVSGDTVGFDVGGAASPTVTISTIVPVAGISVSANTDYTFAGTGAIDGVGGLSKSGAGTLTVNTTNTYTGATTISGGVLAVASLGDADSPSCIGASSASASNLVIQGGTLRLIGPQTNTNRNLTLGSSGGTLDVALSTSSIQVSGSISGSGSLTKNGAGTLLLAAANPYSGGTVINAGKIYLAGSTPNSSGLGTGTVTINNGTLSMGDVQASETAAWNLVVPSGAVARLDADGRCSLTGSLTGGGTLSFFTPYVRTEMKGNWSAFTGQINVITDADGGDFRVNNAAGYANAKINLDDNVYFYSTATVGSSGTTIDLGELSGTSLATVTGGPTGGRTLTWRVGAKGTDATFNGAIKDGTSITAITKNGAGIWTLAGNCTYTGPTNVTAGILKITGSVSGTSGLTVSSGAAVELAGGALSIAGAITNNGTIRFKGTPIFSSTGSFTNNGVLDLINGPATLPAGFVNNGILVDSSAVKAADVSISGANFIISVKGYAGHTYQLQRADSLMLPTWTNVGSLQNGTGGTLILTDIGGANGTQHFYRVQVN
jgi:autotransporter-associated beta strand protein